MIGEPRRIVVTGASGNVGSGVLRALAAQLPDAELVGVCRRPPADGEVYRRVRWHAVDLSAPGAAADLAPAMHGADAVIHLALAVRPTHDEDYLYRANVLGSRAVLAAMTSAGIRRLIYASSLGVYAPGATSPVAESWPDTGQDSSTYSRHKVIVERLLDQYELEHPDVSIARFRPTVVVQRQAAYLIRSLYLGPLVPRLALELLRGRALRVLPLPSGIALQFVHADDVGDAVVRMITRGAVGSFNVAADVLDADALAGLVGARPVDVSPRLVRGAVSALNRVRLVALTPGWYDVAANTPLMDTTKAQLELGWAPSRSSADSARELLDGLADGIVGASAATGSDSSPSAARRATAVAHDVSLGLWSAAAVARAAGFRRVAGPEAAVAAANLAAGTPMALDRLRERRRDPVALAAPVLVAAAVVTSVRGGWPAVAATGLLNVVNVLEHRRARRRPPTDAVVTAPDGTTKDR